MMSVRLTAIAAITILLFSIASAVAPVEAHFTLGNLTGTYRFHSEDFDPHVSGVVGYVWPGGGLDSYVGAPNLASSVLSPGYQSPYPCTLAGEPTGNGGIVGTAGNAAQCNPTGAPTSSSYQLQGSAYAPFGAVLAGSTGDLIFALNATAETCPGGHDSGTAFPTLGCSGNDPLGWSGVTIFLPPGFMLPTMDGSDVVTTVTNSYANIQVYVVSPYDRYAPGWTAVNIWSDGGQSAIPNGGVSYYNHQFINFTNAGEWYYFRINQVTAPTVAGRYFFKILLSGDSNYIAGQEGTATNRTASISQDGINNIPGEAPTQFIPTQNWPVLLVKGEIDSAIVTGTVRYGGYNSTLYGQPIGEAGRVYAHMEDKIDPYTGEQIIMCPAVGQPSVPGCTDAVGYFNATAQGHYEVEGVAPGVYTIYTEAAGFSTQVCASGVTVLKGQSLHFDCYVQPGPVIHGNVFSKHQFGDEPWTYAGLDPLQVGGDHQYFCQGFAGFANVKDAGTCKEYIKVEFYDAPTLTNIPDPSAHLVSWSPLPCVAGGQDVFFPKGSVSGCGTPSIASQIAFPWHEYILNAGPTPTGNGFDNYGAHEGVQVSESALKKGADGCGMIVTNNCLTTDPQGVGPPQLWVVQSGTTTPFHFEFGVKGEYGAPRDLDGMVPQVYATWVNGLTPGRYYARAWFFRYVQTALDGSTFQEYYFDITPQEWAGDVTLPIDLRLSSWVNKTVHFHDQINSLKEDPINTGAGFMSGYLMGTDGNIYSYNQTALGIVCLTPPFRAPSPTLKCTFGGVGWYPYPGGGWTDLGAHYGGYSGVPPGFMRSGTFETPSGVKLDPYYESSPVPPTTIEFGVNQNAIQEGRANIQFWGIDGTWSGEDYGIPSGTYTPYTFVLGYLPEGPLEQVSVTLSGTMTAVSDHMIRGPGFNVTIYSVDWERPTVNRAWEFGNPEGWNLDEGREALPSIPLAIKGFYGSDISGSSSSGFINSNSVGAEIDLGAYGNGSLADWTGDAIATALPSSITTTNLFQNQFENNVTLNGGGFAITGINGALFDANESWFGSELKLPGAVGGWLGASTAFGAQPFLACFSPTSCPFNNINSLFIWPHVLEPTAFQPGEYNFGAFTYGYVHDQGFTVAADVAQIADVRLNLVIGVNITLDILFKKEHVITPTDMNMSGRVRIFNNQGQLVGEWMSSNGVYTPSIHELFTAPNGVDTNGRAVAADGTLQFPFGPLHAAVPQPNPLNEYNYIPGGVSLLHAQIAGLPQVPAAGYDAPPALPSGTYSGDPVFTPGWCDFQLDCYASGYTPGGHFGPGPTRISGSALTYPSTNTGIPGYPDYQAGWTAEVDLVPWYANNTNTMETSSGGQQVSSCLPSICFGQYYTPVQGLLLGESYHIIPGTTASSGISLTEDAALSSAFLGHSMVFDHLGPYSQEGVWQISGTYLSGEASGIFEVDLNGFISGTALAFTWANDFRPLSWATVSVTGASGATWNYYTSDGLYGLYLPGGSYSLTIASPGIASQTLSVAVTGGEVGTAGNVYMQQSNIPVPEFSGLAVVVLATLAASIYILRKRRK